MLIFAIHQNDSVLQIHTLFHILFHYDLPQAIEHRSLCCNRSTWMLTCSLYNTVHLLIPNSQPGLPSVPLPRGNCTSILCPWVFLFCRYIHLRHSLNSTLSAITWYLSLSDLLQMALFHSFLRLSILYIPPSSLSIHLLWTLRWFLCLLQTVLLWTCWGTCTFLNYSFVRIYPQGWDCWITIFSFLRNLHTIFHSDGTNSHSHHLLPILTCAEFFLERWVISIETWTYWVLCYETPDLI